MKISVEIRVANKLLFNGPSVNRDGLMLREKAILLRYPDMGNIRSIEISRQEVFSSSE